MRSVLPIRVPAHLPVRAIGGFGFRADAVVELAGHRKGGQTGYLRVAGHRDTSLTPGISGFKPMTTTFGVAGASTQDTLSARVPPLVRSSGEIDRQVRVLEGPLAVRVGHLNAVGHDVLSAVAADRPVQLDDLGGRSSSTWRISRLPGLGGSSASSVVASRVAEPVME